MEVTAPPPQAVPHDNPDELSGVPPQSSPPPSTSAFNKKLWRTAIWIVLGMLLILALREFVSRNGQWQQVMQFIEQDQEEQSPLSELEQQVIQSKERQAAIAQLANTCEAKNTSDSCVFFSLNEETLSCDSRPKLPCCGNGVCEAKESGACSRDCQLQVGQSQWDGLISVKFDTDKQEQVSLLQSFQTPNIQAAVSEIHLGIELASGLDQLQVSLVEDQEATDSALWQFLVATAELPARDTLRLSVVPPVTLEPNSVYSLRLGLVSNLGSVTFRSQSYDIYKDGALVIINQGEELNMEEQSGDLLFQIMLNKPVITYDQASDSAEPIP